MFKEILKELRKENNVTQEELANFLGVTRTTITGYETKGKSPSFDKLKLIAKFFDVSTDYLLGLDHIPNRSISEKLVSISEYFELEGLPDEAYKEFMILFNYIEFKYKVYEKSK